MHAACDACRSQSCSILIRRTNRRTKERTTQLSEDASNAPHTENDFHSMELIELQTGPMRDELKRPRTIVLLMTTAVHLQLVQKFMQISIFGSLMSSSGVRVLAIVAVRKCRT